MTSETAAALYDAQKDTPMMDWPPALMELVKAVNEERSGNRSVARLITEGKLGIVARALTEMEEAVSMSGYAPTDRRGEVHRFETAAATTTGGVAAYYRERARKARSQMGETTR